jgi:hypothetical protein
LRFALGRREEKSEGEIRQEMQKRKYNPKADALMPRLFRKMQHQTTSNIGSKFSNRNFSVNESKQISVYDNDTSVFGSK